METSEPLRSEYGVSRTACGNNPTGKEDESNARSAEKKEYNKGADREKE